MAANLGCSCPGSTDPCLKHQLYRCILASTRNRPRDCPSRRLGASRDQCRADRTVSFSPPVFHTRTRPRTQTQHDQPDERSRPRQVRHAGNPRCSGTHPRPRVSTASHDRPVPDLAVCGRPAAVPDEPVRTGTRFIVKQFFFFKFLLLKKKKYRLL